MEINVLVDNKAREGFVCEWGLSLLIQHESGTVLLDAGSSCAFSKNAKHMDIDLSCVDAAVLSHAHFDHANGMPTFFNANKTAPLYVSKQVAKVSESCWSKATGQEEYIGVEKGFIKSFADRIVLVSHRKEILPGIWVLPHTTPNLEKMGLLQRLYIKNGKRLDPDDFSHEMTLVIEAVRGLVVFSSCTHVGVEVILEEVKSSFPGKGVLAMIGGFHLFIQPEKKAYECAQILRKHGICRVITGHCTGDAYEILLRELGEDVVCQFASGAVFNLEI